MNSDVDGRQTPPKHEPAEFPPAESLNDLMDRLSREAFHRLLEHRSVKRPEPTKIVSVEAK